MASCGSPGPPGRGHRTAFALEGQKPLFPHPYTRACMLLPGRVIVKKKTAAKARDSASLEHGRGPRQWASAFWCLVVFIPMYTGGGDREHFAADHFVEENWTDTHGDIDAPHLDEPADRSTKRGRAKVHSKRKKTGARGPRSWRPTSKWLTHSVTRAVKRYDLMRPCRARSEASKRRPAACPARSTPP
jgi:hypothetical protein